MCGCCKLHYYNFDLSIPLDIIIIVTVINTTQNLIDMCGCCKLHYYDFDASIEIVFFYPGFGLVFFSSVLFWSVFLELVSIS